ncbi:MAG: pancreas/duodenum homeobox protein 1 [Proteobacteria bacterium]|nr:pancreas/duodenum homeobox protein 1 [Pseudomonadota bacterium]
MAGGSLRDIFTHDVLKKLFPEERADMFFDALLGDVNEGAYDISLAFNGHNDGELQFELQLRPRPGRCLACNLTYGLPQVFFRHPAINLNGLFKEINDMVNEHARCTHWKLGRTKEVSSDLHIIPLIVFLDE